MTRTELHDFSDNTAATLSSADPPRRQSAPLASLRRLDDYIRRDEHSLARQRRILADCDGPARAVAEATVAEYERSLRTLYRRRARLLTRA